MSVIYLLADPSASTHFKVGIGSTIGECILKETITEKLFGNEIKITPELIAWIELDKCGDVDTLKKGLYLNLGNKCISKEEGIFKDISIEEVARAANRCNQNGKINKYLPCNLDEDDSPTVPSTPCFNMLEDYEEVIRLIEPDDYWTKTWESCISCEKEGKEIPLTIMQWLEDQKSNFEILSEEQLEKLLQIKEFKNWYENKKQKRVKRSWEENFQLCLEYEKEIREITETAEFKGVKIGTWYKRQKRATKERRVDRRRVQQLMKLNGFMKWYNNGFVAPKGQLTQKRRIRHSNHHN